MRDFRDAKAMAHTLRALLAAKGHKITLAESLELIAKTFGAADWNTLSALIAAQPARGQTPGSPPAAPPAAPSSGRVGFAPEFERTLHRAVAGARQDRRLQVTLEHLLLALVDDADAAAVLEACAVDGAQLKTAVARRIDEAPPSPAAEEGETPAPSAGVQRVIQRAVIHVTASGQDAVTGGNVLVALFSEAESPAAACLAAAGLTRLDAVNYLAHGIARGDGGVSSGGDGAAR